MFGRTENLMGAAEVLLAFVFRNYLKICYKITLPDLSIPAGEESKMPIHHYSSHHF
jgi:hypothetical protein